MVEEKRVDLEKPQGHYCFACGTANPIGLNLQFYRLGDTVCSDITLNKYHEGWENIAHGGLISTLLDEVMSWTAICFKKAFFVTRKIDIKYLRPVFVGTPLIVRGRIAETSKFSRINVKGEVIDDQGKLLVRSAGEFVELPHDRLALFPEEFKNDMLRLFDKF